MAVDEGLLVLEEGDVAVELVADLHAELALAADAGAEAVELLVLLGEHLAVVGVHLHVGVEPRGVVAVAGGRVRVVPVGPVEESRGGGVFVVGVGAGALGEGVGGRGGGVLEADGLAVGCAAAWCGGAERFLGGGRGGGGGGGLGAARVGEVVG